MIHVSNRSQQHSQLHLFSPGLVHAVHGHVGCCPHTVPHVVDFVLASVLQGVVQHGWKIIFGHFIPGEPPEILVTRIQRNMASAVCVSLRYLSMIA